MESFSPTKTEQPKVDEPSYEFNSDSFLSTQPTEIASKTEILAGNNPQENEVLTDFKSLSEQSADRQGQWDPEGAMIEYTARNEEVAQKLADVESRLNSLHHDEEGHDFDETEIDTLITERGELQQEKLTVSANYPGDWTLLLHDRMIDPTTKEKFINQRTASLTGMQTGEPGQFDKQKTFQSHYQTQIDNYDQRVAKIFNSTDIGTANEFGKQPSHLGTGNIDETGIVFSDAEKRDGSPLSFRQKNIIEAHEKGHGLRDFQSTLDKAEVQSIIDDSMLEELIIEHREQEQNKKSSGRFQSGYLRNPAEIIERMSQFKNYFGMSANENFTKKHLDYAREHYVEDTGLDNGVSDLFYVVTPETEDAFLDIINKYPI